MKNFLLRFGSLLSFYLSGFGRLRFRGEARLLSNDRGVASYLYQQQIRFVDFVQHADALTNQLRRQTEQDARDKGVPLEPLNLGSIDKEARALELARQHGRTTGRLA